VRLYYEIVLSNLSPGTPWRSAFSAPCTRPPGSISLHLEARTRALGVSPAEGHLLTYLRRYAPAPVGELARVFGTKQSTLTSILDRLERDGLLRRAPNPTDRRSFCSDSRPRAAAWLAGCSGNWWRWNGRSRDG
jgi:DNA-binding transcriptional ArsR family regulator